MALTWHYTGIGRVLGGVLVVFDTESVISSSAMHVQCMNVAQNAIASHSVLMYNYTESCSML